MRIGGKLTLVVALLFSGMVTSCTTTDLGTIGGTQTGGTLAQTDKNFITQAASSGMMEVRASEIALEKSSSLEVREFAKLLRQYHLKANSELSTLATQNRASVPNTMSAEHKAMVDQIARLNAPEFDKAFVQQMESMHKQDIALYQSVVSSSQSVTLRGFALKTIPVLQGHLKMATQLKNMLP